MSSTLEVVNGDADTIRVTTEVKLGDLQRDQLLSLYQQIGKKLSASVLVDESVKTIPALPAEELTRLTNQCHRQIAIRQLETMLDFKCFSDSGLNTLAQLSGSELDQRGNRPNDSASSSSGKSTANFTDSASSAVYSQDAESIIDLGTLSSPVPASLLSRSLDVLRSRGEHLDSEVAKVSKQDLRSLYLAAHSQFDKSSELASVLRDLSPAEVRKLIEISCKNLSAIGEQPPRDVQYKPLNVLNLPWQIREQIYELVSLEAPNSGFKLRFYNATASTSTAEQRFESHEAKRRKLNSQEVYAGVQATPNIVSRFDGQTEFSKLVLVNKQLWRETVGASFAENRVNIKIDCSQAKCGDRIVDFWDQLFPRWLLGVVHNLDIEVRCSIEQWRDMSPPFRRRFTTYVLREAKVRLRVVLAHAEADQAEYLQSQTLQFNNDEKAKIKEAWFGSYSRRVTEEFKSLQTIDCLSQFQVLQLKQTVNVKSSESYSYFDVGLAETSVRAHNSWKAAQPQNLAWQDHLHPVFIEIGEGYMIKDL